MVLSFRAKSDFLETGIIAAITGTTLGLNVISEFIAGYIYEGESPLFASALKNCGLINLDLPGLPLANVTFKVSVDALAWSDITARFQRN